MKQADSFNEQFIWFGYLVFSSQFVFTISLNEWYCYKLSVIYGDTWVTFPLNAENIDDYGTALQQVLCS